MEEDFEILAQVVAVLTCAEPRDEHSLLTTVPD